MANYPLKLFQKRLRKYIKYKPRNIAHVLLRYLLFREIIIQPRRLDAIKIGRLLKACPGRHKEGKTLNMTATMARACV